MTPVPTLSNGTHLRPPFVLELRSEEIQPNGSFTPAAAVLLTPALRKSGLISTLSAEDLRTLLGVLSCLTPNGTFAATPELLAPTLGLSVGQARERLLRLSRLKWQEEALLSEHSTETGLRIHLPSTRLFDTRKSYVLPQETTSLSPDTLAALSGGEQTIRGGFREQIIAHSRALYARPRAEVEAEIKRFLGYEDEEEMQPATPEDAAQLKLMKKLVTMGMDALQADLLLNGYPHERIERQLAWLPYRRARNPVGFLVAAIEHDYDPPLGVRVPIQHPNAQAIESTQNARGQIDEEGSGKNTRVIETVETEPLELVELELPPDDSGAGQPSNAKDNAAISTPKENP